jgi:hypothetical protein
MALVLLTVVSTAAGAQDHTAEAAIKALMAAQFDRPEQRLMVNPVVVEGDHAIAGWVQGDMGGRALLRRKGHDWQLVLCSGDQIKAADALVQIGLPKAAAASLAKQLAEAESKLPHATLAMFSKFDGIVMMDAAGHHPPAHHPHHGQ